ncbi:MAG TPA: helix-turn-helix domain-containing protein [Burkholderiales bacterium]|nr:helix-turn-helix domain-containing protein [Burkholderiales bacterium]
MSEPVEHGAPSARESPGRMLAQLRDERKLSIADVAQRLKYGARQIEALEADEFDKLPGATFVRGMVRGYAKLLDTDPEPVLSALEQRYVPGEVSLDLRAKRIPFPEGGKRGTRVYLVLSLLALVVVAGVLYEWRVGIPWARLSSDTPSPQKQAQDPPAMIPAAPPAETKRVETRVAETRPPETRTAETRGETRAAEARAAETRAAGAVPGTEPATAPPDRASAGEGRLRLEFDGESWVEIREQDGKTLMSQLNPAGSRRVVVGRPPLILVIGNAASVRVTYNDKPVDLTPYIQIEVARLTLE